MRLCLIALALAAAAAIVIATDPAGATYGKGYRGHHRQTCIIKRIHTEAASGAAISKRVRICQ